MINMTKVVASITWNAVDYGSAVNQYIGVGLTPSAFEKEIVEPSHNAPSVDSPACYSIARGLGLTPMKSSLRHEMRGILAKQRIWSEALKLWVEPGNVKGQEVACILDTEEGVQVVCESVGFIFGEPGSDEEEAEEMKVSMWGGVPDKMVIRSKDVMGKLLTCTPMVNRLPQMLNGEPGFITPDMAGLPPYLAKGFPKMPIG
jgi:4-hydroxy-tetrahydrodipicolinate reductase